MKEKLIKSGVNFKQENHPSNYFLIFDLPVGSVNKHYELLIQKGNNKILEYKKSRGKDLIVSVLNTEGKIFSNYIQILISFQSESNEKIILEDLSSLYKELDFIHWMINFENKFIK